MFRNIFNCKMKDMLRRKEFLIAFTLSILLFLAPCLIDLYYLFGSDIIAVNPAWTYWGELNAFIGAKYTMQIRMVVYLMVLPFLSSLAYSYCYFDDYKSGAIKVILTRISREKYYISSVLTVFLSGFFIVFVPLALAQLIFCVACPLETLRMMGSEPFLDDNFQFVGFFRSIGVNSPYLYNLIYCAIPGIVSGLLAQLSFSLFYHKSRFIVLTLPGILWVLIQFIISVLNTSYIPIYHLLMPPIGVSNMTLSHIVLLILVPVIINCFTISYKLLKVKDEV